MASEQGHGGRKGWGHRGRGVAALSKKENASLFREKTKQKRPLSLWSVLRFTAVLGQFHCLYKVSCYQFHSFGGKLGFYSGLWVYYGGTTSSVRMEDGPPATETKRLLGREAGRKGRRVRSMLTSVPIIALAFLCLSIPGCFPHLSLFSSAGFASEACLPYPTCDGGDSMWGQFTHCPLILYPGNRGAALWRREGWQRKLGREQGLPRTQEDIKHQYSARKEFPSHRGQYLSLESALSVKERAIHLTH